jgi:hypothetical protein
LPVYHLPGCRLKKTEFNWQKIGEKSVDFKTNKDAITISATDNFKALQIKTADAPVHIDNLVVVYEAVIRKISLSAMILRQIQQAVLLT